DSYALSLRPPSGDPDAARNQLTSAASHEVAEAITNTGNGYRLTAADKDHPWRPGLTPNPSDPDHGFLAQPTSSRFLEDEGAGNIEPADMLAGSQWVENATPPAFTSPVPYSYVRVFTPFANDHRNDPGVPPTPDPYFNVSTASDWYKLALGSS